MKLIIQNMTKTFKNKQYFEDTSLVFKKGTVYGILGRTGSGKSTLFNCIAQNSSLDEGEIILMKDTTILNDYSNNDVRLVTSEPIVPKYLTGYEYIKSFVKASQVDNQDETTSHILSRIGIEEKDHHSLLKEYSPCMKNRVQMMVSLMIKPKVLLLDEAMITTDAEIIQDYRIYIKYAKIDSIVIIATNDFHLAHEYCDELYLIHSQGIHQLTADQLEQPFYVKEIMRLLSDKEDE